MQNYSLTYTGIIVSIVGFILSQLGVPFEMEQLTASIAFILNIGGALVALYGRFRNGDVTWSGAKK